MHNADTSAPDDREWLTPEAVMALERAYIEYRRHATGREQHVTQEGAASQPSAPAADEAPPASVPDVGLAFSGGGIRSATFGLGVLEGLKAHKLLEGVDYLSTVSGGGYIGAWLSANCVRARRRAHAAGAAASWLGPAARWDESIAWLRRYSNYLSPQLGFFSADTWSMFTVWLRNAMLVQATVVFTIACALLVTRLAVWPMQHWSALGVLRHFAVLCFVLAVAGIAFNLRLLSRQGQVGRPLGAPPPGGWVAVWSALGVAALAGAALVAEQGRFDPFSHEPVPPFPSLVIAMLGLVAGYLLMPGLVALARRLRALPERRGRLDFTQGEVQFGIVMPLLVSGLMMAAALWEQVLASDHLRGGPSFSAILGSQFRHWSLPLALALTALWLLARCTVSLKTPNPEIETSDAPGGAVGLPWRRLLLVWLAPLAAAGVLYLALCGILSLMLSWQAADPVRAPWLAMLWGPPLVLYTFSVVVVVLIGMLGRRALEGTREWWSRLGAWLLIYGAAWLVAAVAAVYGPRLFGALFDGAAGGWSSTWLAWLATTGAGLVAGRSGDTGKAVPGQGGTRSRSSAAKEALAQLAPFLFIAGLLVVVATALHLLILNLSCDGTECDWLLRDLHSEHWRYLATQSPMVLMSMLVICGAIATLLSHRVDINVFSLNMFYRNRLNRCYLGASRFARDERHPQRFTGFDDADDLPMRQLAQEAAGPLHIVNCALNLGGSSDLALHTRHSGSFVITPLAIGSGYISLDPHMRRAMVGYRHTEKYGGSHHYPTLGQAISVSGAAANPNMGFHTAPSVAFLLTMFNARLGWWFPNPRRRVMRSSPAFSLPYLLRELFGMADEKLPFLNVSDGGHFENLGAYELVRRRCGVIIISDAECDPDLKFEGLAQLIRMCRVDFDVDIDIDVSAIRGTGDSPWSANRCAVGTIKYPDVKDKATLIYIKAAMTGRESEAILQYKATHPAFPHESTGNQFYGEAQFESYRHLGREIVEQAFRHVASLVGERHDGWTHMARRLRETMAPSLSTIDQFSRHTQTLMALWARLGSTADLKLLDKASEERVSREWPDGAPPDAYRPVYYLCNEILQLMENVYLDLDLESTWCHPDNAGWRTTFREWVARPVLRRTWGRNSGAFGARFRHFCRTRLRLDEQGGLLDVCDECDECDADSED